MQKKKIAFIHTVTSLVSLFNNLAREMLPDNLEIFHIADEVLLRSVLAARGITPLINQRVASHVVAAEQCGADIIQVTCSSISPCVDPAQLMVDIPVLKIDEPMVNKALSIGKKIGIAATAPTTLKPTSELVHRQALKMGLKIEIDALLCEGAYDALFAGDRDRHDDIVRDYIKTLMSHNDIVLLAQASMARVADTIPADELIVPVLSSPRLAIEQIKQYL